MTNASDRWRDFDLLLDRMLDGLQTDEEAARLNQILRTDTDACCRYLEYVQLHGRLLWGNGCNAEDSEFRVRGSGEAVGSEFKIRDPQSDILEPRASIARPSPSSLPIVFDLSPTALSSHRLLTPGGFLFSYLTAAVILGIGLLTGWMYRISYDRQMVPDVPRWDASVAVAPEKALPFVGRITGMVDCQWADPAAKAVDGAYVPRGRTYALALGFMEITYDTGAKVILQGPATYTVESASGGYLALGKLTARVEKQGLGIRGTKVGSAVELPNQLAASGSKGERTANPALSQQERGPTASLAPRPSLSKDREVAGEKGEGGRGTGDERASGGQWAANPKSQILIPQFVVRTPTAVVTDLGTEFGVEVDRSGTTRSHVFRGRIELRSSFNREPAASAGTILDAGQSARVARDSNRSAVVIPEPGQPDRFVRRLPPTRLSTFNSRLSTLNSQLCRYRLTDLGTPGGAASCPQALNAAGQVVGSYTTGAGGTFVYSRADIKLFHSSGTGAGVTHTFLYSGGKMQDLDALRGYHSSAYGINAAGQVVGAFAVSENVPRAFLYSDGRMKNIGTLGGATSHAYDINAAGRIVGLSQNSRGIVRAFLYTSGAAMRDLGTLGGPTATSWACGINTAGQVVGCSETADGRRHAFLYSENTGIKDLGTLGGDNSFASRVNDRGQVVGGSMLAGNAAFHAFLYSSETGMKDLGTLGGANSFALYTNSTGQVVGRADCVAGGAAQTHAFLYSGGKMIDLNSLVDSSSGWTLVAATAINDLRQIAGLGVAPDGHELAFLLTPVVVQASRLHEKQAGETPAPQQGDKEK